ncbi:hypothetical protein Lalb_Chr12g0209121 [Lupinus albus]|uniref:Uncharacterized protein n=1 Tax=Lupinus albus TaxID=3870 RepID=A0A6A4PNX1_LUPAL|nr:hypothetical protein Lalb_Chr12g0209121 [Lupinus albus]
MPQNMVFHYTLDQALNFVAKNGTVIVCIVSQPYLPFLNNLLISVTRQKRHDMVLVIAEDYTSLDEVNEHWPGHAVIIPHVLDAENAHKCCSKVCNFCLLCCIKVVKFLPV